MSYKTTGLKRKRYKSEGPMKRRVKSKRFVPGVDRTGGYYGRFSGRDSELKFLDTDQDDAVVAIGGVIFDTINGIPQGTDQSERIGRKITLKSINMHYEVSLPAVNGAASPDGGDVVRMIVYLDKQCNGAASTSADILAGGADHQAFRALANTSRYIVFMDKFIDINRKTLCSTQNADTFDHSRQFISGKFYKKVNIPLEYGGVGATVAELRSNNVGVLLMTATGVAGYACKTRIRYADN